MPVEFHVQGQPKDCEIVADELAEMLKTIWGVPTTRKPTPREGEAVDSSRGVVIESALLAIHVLIVAHAAYERFVAEPIDKGVAKWRDMKFFAIEKRPTLIRAIIGNEDVLLHESNPERMYDLTRRAFDSAIIDLG